MRAFLIGFVLFASSVAAQQARPLPELAAATRIWSVAAEGERDWSQLLDELARLDVVFLGETHIDDTTHRVEHAVLQGLLQRRAGKVVLTMEMFERDSQPVLDAYLKGEIDEPEFVRRSGAWGNYRTGYRALIETAKKAGIPVVAANFPRSLRRALAGGGKQAIERLSPEQRALMPDEIFPATEAYWKRVDNAIRGHMGFGGGAARTPEQRRYATQNLWDNSMGDHVAKARAAHPDSLVLHVAGGFHVAYRDGTVAQFEKRSAGCTSAVVQVSPTAGPELARPERDRDEADYLIYTRQVGRGFHEGNFAVSVGGELRYRLEVPDATAAEQSVPLLLWLPDGRSRPEDAMAFWQAALGDDAAIAVVEHPFPELQADLAVGGRYAFGDGFRADYSRMQSGLVRIVEYVTRFWPIDRERIVIAGEGAGGTVVLWSGLYGDWLTHDLVAFDPAELKRLSMEALPDKPPVVRGLHLVARQASLLALAKVVADFKEAGAEAAMTQIGTDGRSMAAMMRGKLGLALGTPAGEAPTVWLELEVDTPRAREWAELYAASLARIGMQARVVAAEQVPADAGERAVRRLQVGGDGAFPLSSFAMGAGLPLPGGSFGGTTIVVLPEGTSDADRQTWLGYADKKVIKRRSQFANLAVAEWSGERALPQVLVELKQKGRTRVLIVPAVFCADGAVMQRLRAAAGEALHGMDAWWLPGLGGALAAK